MKNYKIKLLLILLFLSTQITTSQKTSQNSQRSNQNSNSVESIEKKMVKIQEKLGLDGLQAVMVQNILEKYDTKKKQLRNQTEDRQIMTAEMQDLSLKQNQELTKVLTEEQITDLQSLFKEQNSQKNPQSKKGKGTGKRKGKGTRHF